eukprot:4746198-Pyramimonas_sp.AAC.1
MSSRIGPVVRRRSQPTFQRRKHKRPIFCYLRGQGKLPASELSGCVLARLQSNEATVASMTGTTVFEWQLCHGLDHVDKLPFHRPVHGVTSEAWSDQQWGKKHEDLTHPNKYVLPLLTTSRPSLFEIFMNERLACTRAARNAAQSPSQPYLPEAYTGNTSYKVHLGPFQRNEWSIVDQNASISRLKRVAATFFETALVARKKAVAKIDPRFQSREETRIGLDIPNTSIAPLGTTCLSGSYQ